MIMNKAKKEMQKFNELLNDFASKFRSASGKRETVGIFIGRRALVLTYESFRFIIHLGLSAGSMLCQYEFKQCQTLPIG